MINMKKNINKCIKIFIVCILFIGAIFVSKVAFHNNECNNFLLNDKNEKLIISSYNFSGKSDITEINTSLKNKKQLVFNRNVWLSGNLSEDKNYLVYMDAIADEPWQVFLLNLKNKKTYKVTTDNYKKFHGKYGMKGIIYFQIFKSESDAAKIARVNIKNRTSNIFDISYIDRSFEAYDVRNNKIVAASVSNSENNRRLEMANKENSSLKPIVYSIYEMDGDGSNMKKIGVINAQVISSISYNYNCKKVIVCGKGINNEKGNGIFEICISNGKIKKLLTDISISKQKNSDVKAIGSNSVAVVCKNEQLMYFNGIPKNTKMMEFKGINSFPMEIYSYNFSNHQIKEVYKSKEPSIITDLTVSY